MNSNNDKDRKHDGKFEAEQCECCSEDWGVKVGALIDNELAPADAVKAGEHLLVCDKCRDFAAKLRRLKGVTDTMKLADLPDARWRQYWTGIYNRIERGIGWVFMSIGLLILIVFGGYYIFEDFFIDPEVPISIKVGMGAFGIGIIILLISVGREAYFRHKTDRYKEVDL